jgi:Skp family chaperone for outer membrane proteins
MSSLDSFIATFGKVVPEDLPEGCSPNPLAAFMDKFSGPAMTSYWFYDKTVEIRFDPVDHVYYKVEELGNLTALLNVSTVSHIVDRSFALIPWCAKVTIEKLLRIIPTENIATGPDDPSPLVVVPMMSIAEFTKFALIAKTAHKDTLEDAGDVGHMAHDWIERYIKAVLAKEDAAQQVLIAEKCPEERAANAVTAMLAWKTAHNVRWIATEKKCYSKEHNCSGTMDGLALVDSCSDPTCCKVSFKDHLSLIDWKTSNYLYVEFLFQTAGYMGFHLEEFPATLIIDRWIIRLGKDDAEFDPWYLPAETFEPDYEGFLACLNLKRIVLAADERLKVQKQGVRAAKKAAKEYAKEIAKAEEKVAKALHKAQVKIDKEEEKRRAKVEAKAAREVAKVEAKAAKKTKTTKENFEQSVEKNTVLLEKLAKPTDAEVKEILSGPFTIEPLVLSKTDQAAFIAALDSPPPPKEELRKALQKYDVGEISEEQFNAVLCIPMDKD